MKTFARDHAATTEVDISSSQFWNQTSSERERAFAQLRKDNPVSWHRPVEVPFDHEEKGFWAVVRAEDISEISKRNDVFCSGLGVTLEARPLELSKSVSFFLVMDAPEHTKFRQLVSAAFTPKQIKRIQDQIDANAKNIVDNLVSAGEVDLVRDFAALLPMRTIADMVGVPQCDKETFARAADTIVGAVDPLFGDPNNRLQTILNARDYLRAMGEDLAEQRRRRPQNDLMTNLVQAEIDGQRLTNEHIGSFMVLFAVAGNDTTKQTTTSTVISLEKHPDQKAWLMEDFDGRIMGSIEEFVRHASPVQQFTRTALQDINIHGQQIRAGDKVAMFYCSGNRDETVFDNPEDFDLTRGRSPHVGFGGGGIHYCLGNGVAKSQLRSLFKEFLTRVPQVELGTPVPLKSNFINGYTSLPAYIPGN